MCSSCIFKKIEIDPKAVDVNKLVEELSWSKLVTNTENEGGSSIINVIIDLIKDYVQNHNACSNDPFDDICGKIFVCEVLRPTVNELQPLLGFLTPFCVRFCQLQVLFVYGFVFQHCLWYLRCLGCFGCSRCSSCFPFILSANLTCFVCFLWQSQ